MTPWRRHLRRARLALTVLVAVLLIATAVFMGAIQVMLPLATRYPDFIARQLSARLHRPVSFAAISSQWQPSGPLLMVRNLTLGPDHPGGKPITLPHAALKFDFSAWLRPAHRWITLRLSDMELRVEHSRSGWLVVGFGSSAGASHASLQSLPVDLDLRNLRVDFVDDASKRSWHLVAPRLMVVNVGDTIRFGGSMRQADTTQAVRISGRMDAAARNFDVHAVSRGLNLAQAAEGLDLHGYAVHSGQGDIELWAGWRDGKLASATLRYALRDLEASGPDDRSLDLAAFAGVLQATRMQDGWNLAWRGPGKARADIDAAGGVIAQVRGRAGVWHASVAASSVEVGPWLSLLAMAPQAPKRLVEWAAHAKPRLHIDSAAMVWQQGGHYDATLRFSDLHALATDSVPGLALSQGVLRADNQALSLELPPQAATVALTDVFREPFVFHKFGATLVAWREDGAWNIAANQLHFDTGDLAGSAHAHLIWRGGGQRPFVAAYADLEHATIADAKVFLPYRSMPPPLVKWLDHALVGGNVTSGHVLLRGDLDDWPFPDNEGRFEATGVVQNATFDFADNWPRATDVDAAVDFVDNRMGIVATHAKVRGVTVSHAVATIPDLGHGVIGLDINGGGSGAELLDFVRNSPVGANAIGALKGLSIGGTGKFGIKLSIPLDHAEKFSLAGNVDLANADVTADKWKLKLKNLSGPLVIDGKGFRAKDLSATFRGAPATLAMAVGGDVSDPKDVVEASMQTRASAQALVEGYPGLAGLVAHASGVAPFQIGVKVAAGLGNAAAVPTLSVKSSLQGIALAFPAPLDKPANSSLPLQLTLQLPPAGAPLAVSLGDVLQVRGRLADPTRNLPTALAMTFGPTPPPDVPARGLVVSGHASRLDVSGWIQQALAGGASGSFPQLAHADVTTDAAQVFGTNLGALHFTFAAGAADDSIGLDGAAVKGTISVPTTGLMARGITANLQHLYWPEAPASKEAGPPTPPSASSPIAPSAIPPLHARVGDLKLGNAQLGTTTFESTPTLLGMRIDRFDSKGADFSIHSHGSWNGSKASSVSHLVIDISSQDFGKTLAAFGFSGLLAGGKNSDVHIDGTWPGSPTGFSLAWMEGALSIKVGEGRILAVKPGLGRVLGLMSLRELPNRLLLHFGDVFKKGFGFDHASATFTLKNGSAYTQDMLITAPAARIALRGRTGFREHDYDLTIDVTPHVGGALPVVGAVIGGPVGAAAGLVVQGLIGKGINKAAANTYRVTGSWDKPKIVTIATAPASAASISAPALSAPVSATSAVMPATASSGG